MPLALLLFLPLITSFLSSVKNGVKDTAQGKYNQALVWLLAAAGVYLLVKGWSTSKQQTYLDNAGTDKNTQQAQALKDAFNRSGIDLLIDLDGTDTDLVFSVAAQITDYKAVSDSYRVLYGKELTTELQRELSRDDLQKFWNIVYKTTPTTTTTGSTTTTTNTSLVGKTVTAIQASNIRVDKAPYDVVVNILGQNKQAKAGDVLGRYVSEMVIPDLPNKGNRNTFVRYEEPAFGGLYYVPYWVLKSAVKIG